MKYLLMSDIHFHGWTTFASNDEHGINSRLKIIANEVIRALDVHEKSGGDKVLVIAGDVFHTRGSVATDTLNYVMDLFGYIKGQGYEIHILSGNHDLQSKDSNRLTSSVTALEPHCEKVYSEVGADDSLAIVFVPWMQSVQELRGKLEEIVETLDGEEGAYDLIIHAPIDNVIAGLPDHGLDAKYLAGLGFKRVFSGHYHNHKDFENGVYSIGATTHQTFSDIGSKAGFLSVGEEVNDVTYHASHAPKFVEITAENYDDAALIVDGNYVRCNITVGKESDVELLRSEFEGCGAKGVVINQVKDNAATEREGVAVSTSSSASLEASILSYVSTKGYSKEVSELCLEILSESAEVEA